MTRPTLSDNAEHQRYAALVRRQAEATLHELPRRRVDTGDALRWRSRVVLATWRYAGGVTPDDAEAIRGAVMRQVLAERNAA